VISVMTAKVIRTANSALYGGLDAVDSCTKAVVRLGIRTTHRLVLSFALREVFTKGPREIRAALKDLWQHSTQVAALCLVLARLSGRFDPEQAMLAGLIHDVGVVAIIDFLSTLQEPARQPEVVVRVIGLLRAEASTEILRRWGFADSFVTAAGEAEDWLRDPGPEADICDLVVVSQLHDLSGVEVSPPLPVLEEVPAFRRLRLGEPSMEGGLVIPEEMANELVQTESLLNI